jgi:flavin-dependent dehydrogenase
MTGAPAESSCDVLVIGAGPAGATLAHRLATIGFDVCIAETSCFPRRRIGESMSPAVFPLLETLGVQERVAAGGFFRPRGAIVRWGARATHYREIAIEPGLQVDRGVFDAILIEAARESGARVIQPARAVSLTPRSHGGWTATLATPHRQITVAAALLAIAGGRRAGFGAHRRHRSAATLALCGYLKNAFFRTPESRIDVSEKGWQWAAPLPDGTISVAIFVDPPSAGLRRDSVEAVFRRTLRESHLLGACADGEIVGALRACDASRSSATPTVGDDFIRVGDAAFSIDPLSSQGVAHAMASALQGAAVVNTLINRPASAQAAKAFFDARVTEMLKRDGAIARAYYREQAAITPTPFWLRRCEGDDQPLPRPRSFVPAALDPHTPLRLAGHSSIAPEPVLIGDFIESRNALRHPSLDRPIAFVADTSIDVLLASVPVGATCGHVLDHWRKLLGEQNARAFFRVLQEKGVLEPVSPAAAAR